VPLLESADTVRAVLAGVAAFTRVETTRTRKGTSDGASVAPGLSVDDEDCTTRGSGYRYVYTVS